MFKNIARTLAHIAVSKASVAQPSLPAPAEEIDTFAGRGKGGKHSSKKGNAAQLKRASKKASNIRKFN